MYRKLPALLLAALLLPVAAHASNPALSRLGRIPVGAHVGVPDPGLAPAGPLLLHSHAGRSWLCFVATFEGPASALLAGPAGARSWTAEVVPAGQATLLLEATNPGEPAELFVAGATLEGPGPEGLAVEPAEDGVVLRWAPVRQATARAELATAGGERWPLRLGALEAITTLASMPLQVAQPTAMALAGERLWTGREGRARYFSRVALRERVQGRASLRIAGARYDEVGQRWLLRTRGRVDLGPAESPAALVGLRANDSQAPRFLRVRGRTATVVDARSLRHGTSWFPGEGQHGSLLARSELRKDAAWSVFDRRGSTRHLSRLSVADGQGRGSSGLRVLRERYSPSLDELLGGRVHEVARLRSYRAGPGREFLLLGARHDGGNGALWSYFTVEARRDVAELAGPYPLGSHPPDPGAPAPWVVLLRERGAGSEGFPLVSMVGRPGRPVRSFARWEPGGRWRQLAEFEPRYDILGARKLDTQPPRMLLRVRDGQQVGSRLLRVAPRSDRFVPRASGPVAEGGMPAFASGRLASRGFAVRHGRLQLRGMGLDPSVGLPPWAWAGADQVVVSPDGNPVQLRIAGRMVEPRARPLRARWSSARGTIARERAFRARFGVGQHDLRFRARETSVAATAAAPGAVPRLEATDHRRVTVLAPTSTPPGGLATAFHGAWPNPLPGAGALAFSLAHGADIEVTLYDLAGRRVRQLHRGPRGAGAFDLHWDGRDDAGRSVANGVYVVRIEAGAERHEGRVALVR